MVHETGHNKVCGLSLATRSWYLDKDITVELFLNISAHHKSSAFYFHYTVVKTDISTVDISKTQQLTPAQSRWIHNSTTEERKYVYDVFIFLFYFVSSLCCKKTLWIICVCANNIEIQVEYMISGNTPEVWIQNVKKDSGGGFYMN